MNRLAKVAAALTLVFLSTAACDRGNPSRWPSASPRATRPYVLILGTAQDGGLPHIGCDAAHCQHAEGDSPHRRLVSSLAIIDPSQGARWLIDASPDIREQLQHLRGHPLTRSTTASPARSAPSVRPPLVDGVFLTHAHIGHYLGLAEFGREANGAHLLPVFGTARMCSFLRTNGPWSLLVSAQNIELHELKTDQTYALSPSLSITALQVPHRDEFTDTVGFVVRGPKRSLLYVPDIDKWERWDRRIEDVIASVDIALVDGTFFADGEITGRTMAEVPHPFISESIARFAQLPIAERKKIVFTHVNHTNPVSNAKSDSATQVRAAGMAVAHDGELLEL